LSVALTELGVGWYVFGAQGVLHWGRPRFTEDVDVTVQLGSVDTSRLVATLQRHGFNLRDEGTAAFIAQTRVAPFVFARSGWALDVVLGGPGLEETFLGRSVSVDVVPGVSVQIISAEDLIVTKILAGRAKDLDDVDGVIRAQADALDVEAIRHTLTMLEEALGVSDLVPMFERVLRQEL
jgi:hypothetical protein